MAAYGSFTPWVGAGFYADALAGYAYFYNQLQRQITIPGLQPRTANGATGANQFLGQAEAGYKLAVFAPAAGDASRRSRGFQAIDRDAERLHRVGRAVARPRRGGSRRRRRCARRLGADLAGAIGIGDTRTLDLDLRLGWQHDYADTSRPITAALSRRADDGASRCTAPRRSVTPRSIGFTAKTQVAQATQLYLRYDGEIGTGTDNHAVNLGVRVSW